MFNISFPCLEVNRKIKIAVEKTSYFPIRKKSKIRARHIRKSPSMELPVLILAIISRSVEKGINRGTPPESMSRNKWLKQPLNIPRLASSRYLDPNLSNRPMKITITGKIVLPIRECVKPLCPIRSLTYRFCSFGKEEVTALMRCLPADTTSAVMGILRLIVLFLLSISGKILPMSAPVIRIMVPAVFVRSSAAVTAPMAIPPSLCVVAII